MIEANGAGLLEQLAFGDEAALSQLYDLFSADVFGVAVRILRDRSLAEDATQETFLSVWRNAASFTPKRGSVRTWILVIARRRSIDLLRSRGSVPGDLDLVGATREGDMDVFSAVTHRLNRHAMSAMLYTLPKTQRRAIELAYFLGLTQVEIARETAAPLGTVKSRVRLGLESIRRQVEASADFEAASSASTVPPSIGAQVAGTPIAPAFHAMRTIEPDDQLRRG